MMEMILWLFIICMVACVFCWKISVYYGTRPNFYTGSRADQLNVRFLCAFLILLFFSIGFLAVLISLLLNLSEAWGTLLFAAINCPSTYFVLKYYDRYVSKRQIENANAEYQQKQREQLNTPQKPEKKTPQVEKNSHKEICDTRYAGRWKLIYGQEWEEYFGLSLELLDGREAHLDVGRSGKMLFDSPTTGHTECVAVIIGGNIRLDGISFWDEIFIKSGGYDPSELVTFDIDAFIFSIA